MSTNNTTNTTARKGYKVREGYIRDVDLVDTISDPVAMDWTGEKMWIEDYALDGYIHHEDNPSPFDGGDIDDLIAYLDTDALNEDIIDPKYANERNVIKSYRKNRDAGYTLYICRVVDEDGEITHRVLYCDDPGIHRTVHAAITRAANKD